MNPYRRCDPSQISQAGTSLIELLISTLLAAVVMTGIMSMSVSQLTSMQDQTKQVDLQSVGRSIMNLFQRESRRIGVDPGCSGAFESIVTGNSQHIVFQSDLDGSGAIDADGERVAYYYGDNQSAFYRQLNGEPEALITGVDLGGSRLRYFDGDGVEIESTASLNSEAREAVRRIRLELVLADHSAKGNHEQELGASLSSDVTLRNRFFMGSTDCETPPE